MKEQRWYSTRFTITCESCVWHADATVTKEAIEVSNGYASQTTAQELRRLYLEHFKNRHLDWPRITETKEYWEYDSDVEANVKAAMREIERSWGVS